jgi:uncharacterized protein (DUF427 family)
MPKAIWRGKIIAEAPENAVVKLEGNIYFPASSLNRSFLQDSSTTTRCPWKGTASYYNVVVEGETNRDAAWTYRSPSDAAKEITGFVAFWHGVEIV